MDDSTQMVLDALRQWRRSYARVDEGRDELVATRNELRSEEQLWASEVAESYLLPRGSGGPAGEGDEEELEGLLWTALAERDPSLLSSWPDVIPDLKKEMARHDRLLREANDQVARAIDAAQPAFDRVVARLSEWMVKVGDGRVDPTEGWPRILEQWIQITGLTTREAGELLGVSSASVVRYLKGTDPGGRTPATATLSDLVARLLDAGPTAGMTELDAAIRSVAQGLGWDRDAVKATLGDEEKARLQVRIEDALPSLELGELQALCGLVEHEGALTALLKWSQARPLQAVADALASVGGAR